MPSHNEQVQPVAFDVADPTPTAADSSGGRAEAVQERPGWIVPALLGLGILAVLVVFWLPGRVSPPAVPEPRATAPDIESPVNKAAPAEQPQEASPWSDAQLAKLRKEAQEVLQQLLETQDLLESSAVNLWAAEAFAAAKELATAGDNHYRERRFEDARSSYEAGLSAMNELLEGTDAALSTQLEAARTAIEAGEREAAEAALTIATAIEPGNAELATLTGRAALLEQLLPLIDEAEAAEARGDLAAAESLLQQAAGIDPAHQRVQAELSRVTAAHTEMRFGDAMSDGYYALDEGRFSASRSAFRRAGKLSPGSTEAASALQEVQVAETAAKLASLQQRGNSAESDERWQDAVNAYEEAIAIDSNILYAQEGLQRSRIRAKLDQQFSTAIAEPDRLSDKTVAQATATLLQQAAGITPRGPVLDAQISQLQALLARASKPLSLTLQSDGETEVIVYKVARLGRFEQRELSLRPGKYTAVGTRNGYRDVRVSFKLSHDTPLPTVTISCTEAI